MKEDTTKPLSEVIRIDESEIRDHLDEMVRGTVEEALNATRRSSWQFSYPSRRQIRRERI